MFTSETKPICKWKQWAIGNGIFAALVVLGLSYQNAFSLVLALCLIFFHICMYFTVLKALEKQTPSGDHIIRVFVNGNTHPPVLIDTIYDSAMLSYLIVVEAYVFALLYFISMLLQRIAMHKAELYLMERPFK